MPYFSIVVPVYNREKVVARCLDSILQQRFNDYEVIVVDDGSTDNTVRVVEGYLGAKVNLMQHTENRGVCPARNTGFVASKGEWIIPFDSDDEMTEDALDTIFHTTMETTLQVGCVKFMVRYDTGELSPEPPYEDEIIEYDEYVGKMDSYVRCEGISVYRAPKGDKAIWPNNRSIETLFHLDRMRNSVMRTVPEVIRIYHRDAGNQFHQTYDRKKIINSAPDMAAMIDGIMKRHSDKLEALAPKSFKSFLTEGCKFHLLSGSRAKGLKYFVNAIRHGCRGRVLPYLFLGMASRELLAFSLGKIKQMIDERRR